MLELEVSTRRSFLQLGTGIVLAGLLPTRGRAQELSLQKELIFRTTQPRNGEPELASLIQSWITPIKHFYVRSHAPNPLLAVEQYRLRVEGMVRTPLTLSLAELLALPTKKIVSTMTCAGNRRAEFNAESAVGGVQWGAGAIGNAEWEGVLLADVLRRAEILPEASHVWFEGLDRVEHEGGIIPFGGSIPVQKAMLDERMPGALLVHKMNGVELTPDHGYPLRTVVPGYIGARSVKWLGKIIVSDRPSPNHFVDTAYKLVRQTQPIDWMESAPIYRHQINAAICTPAAEARIAAGELELGGYAVPTGRSNSVIKSVQLSTDEGKSWTAAKMTGTASEYCWQLWNAKLQVNAGTKSILLKASDTSGEVMPERTSWNAKGYMQNSWFRLPLTVG